MKRIVPLLVSAMLLLSSVGCKNQNATRMGVNAKIVEISKEVNGMVVRSLDENSILGEMCYINCEDEYTYFVYVNNGTGQTVDLKFEDFKVGDEITVDVTDEQVKNKYALASRVQLITQRLP